VGHDEKNVECKNLTSFITDAKKTNEKNDQNKCEMQRFIDTSAKKQFN